MPTSPAIIQTSVGNVKEDISTPCEVSSMSSALDDGLKRNDIPGAVDWSGWDDDPLNPYNWSRPMKARQVLMIASAAFST